MRVAIVIGAVLAAAAGGAVWLGARTPASPSTASPGAAEPALEALGTRAEAGIRVSLSAGASSGGGLRPGGDAIVRLEITDTTTGTGLSGAYPAAWLARRSGAEAPSADTCRDMVESFIGGSVFHRPDVNLNAYDVLVLNDGPTISVVDPQFGFGGSRLLALIRLAAPGMDWALTADQRTLLVSMPEAGRVALVDTMERQVVTELELGDRPWRVALQPDGRRAWVSHGSGDQGGVAAIDLDERRVIARVATGAGPHELAFRADSRHVLVTNRGAGSVSIIDTRSLRVVRHLATGKEPSSLDISAAAGAAYVAHAGDGSVAVIDLDSLEVRARLAADPGLEVVRFAGDGRYGLAANPERSTLHVIDAARTRIVQSGVVEPGPDQITFSSELAYIRHRGSEIVLMVPLSQIGKDDAPIPVVDFPGGQKPFGPATSPAASMVKAPGENAMLIAHPEDRNVYYYREGMAAPMGNFDNYRRRARAVLVVNRTLREQRPGVYQTLVRAPGPGTYDLAFFMNTPRTMHCFEVVVPGDPEDERARAEPVIIEPLLPAADTLLAGREVTLAVRLRDRDTREPLEGLGDVRVVLVRAPGVWQRRAWAEGGDGGVYRVTVTPPMPGSYYMHVEVASRELPLGNRQPIMLEVSEPPRSSAGDDP